MREKIILLLLLTFLYSCEKLDKKSNNLLERKHSKEISIILDTLSNMNSLFAIKKIYLKLDKTDKVLGEINHAFVDNDGNICISDAESSLFIFDSLGNYIKSFSRIGRGPGEYLDFEKFTIDEEGYFYIDDWQQMKIKKYNKNFELISEVYKESTVPFVQMEINNNKLYCFHPFSFSNSIMVYNKNNLKLQDKFGRIDMLKEKYGTRLHCGGMVAEDGALYYVLPNYYQIFKIENGVEKELLTKKASHFYQVDKPVRNFIRDWNNQSSVFRVYKEGNYFFVITLPKKNTIKYRENGNLPTDIINSKGEILKEALFFYNVENAPIKYADKKYISYGYDDKPEDSINNQYVLLLSYLY